MLASLSVDRAPLAAVRARAAMLFGVLAFVLTAPLAALAQETATPSLSGVGTWDSTVKSSGDAGSGQAFTDAELAAIQVVTDYFNKLDTLTGQFVQTDPDQTTLKGKVYVAKPGKFRFEYNRPSRKVVISDGRFLAIQDLDLRSEETYELTNTPFRMLLRADVNLLRDAQILQVEEMPGQVSVVMRDKDPDAPSAIKVVMTTTPELALRGWITRDAQGLETKVEIINPAHGAKLDDLLFKRERLFGATSNNR